MIVQRVEEKDYTFNIVEIEGETGFQFALGNDRIWIYVLCYCREEEHYRGLTCPQDCSVFTCNYFFLSYGKEKLARAHALIIKYLEKHIQGEPLAASLLAHDVYAVANERVSTYLR